MKTITNQAMLITYADSLGGDLPALEAVLDEHFAGVFGGIHILPFFPSSGDRGFAVVEYDSVDPRFGDWDDVTRLADRYYLMADFMINHVSIRSREFLDYMENGDESAFKGMFIHWEDFWPGGGPTESQMDALYRRKDQGPFKEFTRKDGVVVKIWNTFFEEQVDVDPWHAATQDYYERNLGHLASRVPLIRFDAFAYAAKRPGTSCFFVEPEVWEVLDIGLRPLTRRGVAMLPEIHENYSIQLKMAERGHWVYDFALPMLVLHALFTGRTDRLRHWLEICPRKQFTTLDTHDGIGVVDVVGLLTDDEIDIVTRRVNATIADSRRYVKAPPGLIKKGAEGTQQYQLMSSYYSALGEDDAAYLLARIVQLYVPGIPQVYYVGALFGENDIEALKTTGEPRSVNRHNFTEAEIAARLTKPEVRQFLDVLRFRNSSPAFGGEVTLADGDEPGILRITWTDQGSSTTLRADFVRRSYEITARDAGEEDAVVFRS